VKLNLSDVDTYKRIMARVYEHDVMLFVNYEF